MFTGLFSYEKSSSFFGGVSGLAFAHNVNPLPARKIVGIHPVNNVLFQKEKESMLVSVNLC